MSKKDKKYPESAPITFLLHDYDVKSRYWQHMNNAKRRGIDFNMTYEEWLFVWLSSGHFHERGKGREQYVMARYGDTGPYEVGNVKIIPNHENCSEATAGKPKSKEHAKKLRRILNENRPTKPCVVEGKFYSTIKEAAKDLKLKFGQVYHRLHSSCSQWDEWYVVTNQTESANERQTATN